MREQDEAAAQAGVLDPRMTFDDYVVGKGNVLAHAAVRHLVDGAPGAGTMFNPLLIHGASGRGKTHLLQALAHRLRLGPGPLCYLSGRNFRFDHDAARAAGVLLVDDVDRIAMKHQRAMLARAVAYLLDGGRQVVLTSTAAPGQLEFDAETMRRMAGGLIVELGAAEPELRFDILRHKAAAMAASSGLAPPEDAVLRFVAERVPGSGSDLVAVLQSLYAEAVAAGAMPAGMEAGAAVQRILDAMSPRIDIARIQTVVAAHYGLTRKDLLSSRRVSALVMPRHVAMYLAKELLRASLPEIGRAFGGRDHTTALHGIRKVADMLARNAHFAQEVDGIRRKLREATWT